MKSRGPTAAKTQQILGAAILGVGGDEAIHAILDVMSAKAPYTTFVSRTNEIFTRRSVS